MAEEGGWAAGDAVGDCDCGSGVCGGGSLGKDGAVSQEGNQGVGCVERDETQMAVSRNTSGVTCYDKGEGQSVSASVTKSADRSESSQR